MSEVDYGGGPLILPLNDGGTDFDQKVITVASRLEFAERFRRQGKWVKSASWGRAHRPVQLVLGDALPLNRRFWYRDQEPIDLTGYAQLSDGFLPHAYWKWRITVEPVDVEGYLYNVQNPAGAGGASVMHEDVFTKEGELVNLPESFTASGIYYTRVGNFQYGITDDAGGTIQWLDLVWN